MAPKPWYHSNPDLLSRTKDEVLLRHPRLRFEHSAGAVVVRGIFEVREGDVVHDEYEIEVELPRESDRGIPVVRETSGRIPCTTDRHVSTHDGSLCVVLPESYWYHYSNGLSLAAFLDGPLREHLAGQALVEMGEPWPAGEWAHGVNGVLEFYFDVFGTNEPVVVVGLLRLLGRREAKGHWDCPCGSGKRLRDCHGRLVFDLRRRIPPELPARALSMLRESLEAGT